MANCTLIWSKQLLAVFPLAGVGRARLIGTVQNPLTKSWEALTFDDVSHRAIDDLKVQINKVNWFSTYYVCHRHLTLFLGRDAPLCSATPRISIVPPEARA